MESSSDGCNVDGGTERDVCEKISVMEDSYSASTEPIVIHVVEEASEIDGDTYSRNRKFDDELDDLLEEQMVLNRIKKLEKYRRSLANYKDPNQDKIDHRIVPRLKCDEKNDQSTVICSDNNLEDNLLDSFISADTQPVFEICNYQENLKKLSKALTFNILMQSELTSLESFLRGKLKENQKQQIDVKSDISKMKQNKNSLQKKEKPLCWYRSFGRPYFKDEQKFTCAKNEDFKKMKLHNQIISINLFPSRPWKVKEKLLLEEGVRNILIKECTYHLSLKEENLKSQLKCNRGYSACKRKEVKNELQRICNQIEQEKKKSLTQLFSTAQNCNPNREFDWLLVSTKYVPTHSADECQRMWHLYVKPAINKKKFSLEEDKNLLRLVQRYGEQNWDIVAKQLGTSRSEFLCFINYQRRLNYGCNNTGKWKEEEDERLRNLITQFRMGNYIPWAKIAYYFEGRSLAQLHNRWSNCLNPDLKKGRFTKNEDKLIFTYVRKYGENFSKISKLWGYRTSAQLRERYARKNIIVKKNVGRWSLEEDELLLSLVKKFGFSNWSAISKQFITRTRTQIRQRYSSIKRFMLLYPNLGIKDIHRGPSAKSKFLIPVSGPEVESASHEQEDKKLLELIKESKLNTKILIKHEKLMKSRKGRKQITKRSDIDLKLIAYFKDIYSNENLKLQTHYYKPRIDKAKNVLMLFCNYLKTSLILSGEEFERTVKKLPGTLRKVVLELSRDQTGCDSFKANTDYFMKGSSNDFGLVNQDTSSIDCLPVDPKESLVSESYYLLSELTEDSESFECKSNNRICRNKHFISYFLPPNIITMIGCRSVILIKKNFAQYLSSRGNPKNYFFVNDSQLIRKNNLKLFSGYFSDDDDLQLTSNDTVKYNLSDDEDPQLTTNDTVKYNEEEVIPKVGMKPYSSSDTDLKFTAPSSSSDTSIAALYSETLSNDESSDSEDENETEKYYKKSKSERGLRLTKQEAVNLWKERIMSLFGWPFLLANQPPNYGKNTKNVSLTSDENKSELINKQIESSLQIKNNFKNKTENNPNNCKVSEESSNVYFVNLIREDTTTAPKTSHVTCSEAVLTKNDTGLQKGIKDQTTKFKNKGRPKRTTGCFKAKSEEALSHEKPGVETNITSTKRQRKPNKLFKDYKVY